MTPRSALARKGHFPPDDRAAGPGFRPPAPTPMTDALYHVVQVMRMDGRLTASDMTLLNRMIAEEDEVSRVFGAWLTVELSTTNYQSDWLPPRATKLISEVLT